ncbi:MAG: STAS domain-containing protein [Balneolaceae bacterium]
MSYSISISDHDNIAIITFEGRLMGAETQEFHEKIKELIEDGVTTVIGDLSGVEFLNSSGLGMFIASLTSLRKAGGDFILCEASDKIESLFKVSKLFSIFNYYKTLAKAKDAAS